MTQDLPTSEFSGNREVAERLISGCISDDVIDCIIDDVENYAAKGVPLGKWANAKCEHQI
jgi:hypothetical protein